MESLNGKVAVVTGGASGIGRALCARLRARGRARGGRRPRRRRHGGDRRGRWPGRAARPSPCRTDVSRLDRRPGARRPRVRRVRRGPRGLQQRGRRALGRARGGHPPGLGMGDRRQPLGRDPRRRGLRPADDRPEDAGHIVNTASMAGLIASQGLGVYNTTKYAVVGPVRDAAEGPARLRHRRLRPLSHGRQDGDPPERAEPARRRCAMPTRRTRGRRGRADRPLPRARARGRARAARHPRQPPLRHHPRRRASTPLRRRFERMAEASRSP